MKNIFYFIILLFFCSCSVLDPYLPPSISGGTKQNKEYKLDSNHWEYVSKLKNEARSLNAQAGRGEINKIQAAESLNQLRIKLVGHNYIDDDIFNIYFKSVVDSQQGLISSAQSKNIIVDALEGWRTRWKIMDNSQKPTNPAFTNFLMEIMGLEYLH